VSFRPVTLECVYQYSGKFRYVHYGSALSAQVGYTPGFAVHFLVILLPVRENGRVQFDQHFLLLKVFYSPYQSEDNIISMTQ